MELLCHYPVSIRFEMMTLVPCKRFLLNCFKLKILSKTLLEALLTQLFLPTYKITVPGTLCRNNLRQVTNLPAVLRKKSQSNFLLPFLHQFVSNNSLHQEPPKINLVFLSQLSKFELFSDEQLYLYLFLSFYTVV